MSGSITRPLFAFNSSTILTAVLRDNTCFFCNFSNGWRSASIGFLEALVDCSNLNLSFETHCLSLGIRSTIGIDGIPIDCSNSWVDGTHSDENWEEMCEGTGQFTDFGYEITQEYSCIHSTMESLVAFDEIALRIEQQASR